MNQLLVWLAMIAISVLCGYWAQKKGYSFWAYLFAGGLLGAITLLFLPDVKDVAEDKKVSVINKGNTIGIVIAVASFVWGFATGLNP